MARTKMSMNDRARIFLPFDTLKGLHEALRAKEYEMEMIEKGRLSPEQAEELRGLYVEIDKEHAPIPEGYIRFQDLMGCKAINKDTKEVLGTIVDVLSYSPTKNLRVKRENGKTFTVPFVKQFIGEIDLENKTVEIEVVEGLL